jgi:hypothetical protein
MMNAEEGRGQHRVGKQNCRSTRRSNDFTLGIGSQHAGTRPSTSHILIDAGFAAEVSARLTGFCGLRNRRADGTVPGMKKRRVYQTTTVEHAQAAVSTSRSAKKKASGRAERGSKQALSVRCPTCGAGPGAKCELTTGQTRTEPHRDRRLIAKD